MEIKKGRFDVLIEQKNTEESSRLFDCDRVEYISHKVGEHFEHHLMFYRKGKLIYKVWLRNKPSDKAYKSLNEAMKDVGIRLYEF